MRLGSAGAVFFAFAMVMAAVGFAGHALVPGIARLTSDHAQTTTVGIGSTHLPLSRGD